MMVWRPQIRHAMTGRTSSTTGPWIAAQLRENPLLPERIREARPGPAVDRCAAGVEEKHNSGRADSSYSRIATAGPFQVHSSGSASCLGSRSVNRAACAAGARPLRASRARDFKGTSVRKRWVVGARELAQHERVEAIGL